MKIYKMEQWSLTYGESNPYLAPELRTKKLHGVCKERAAELGVPECDEITTTRIVSYEDNIVTTRSGTPNSARFFTFHMI